MRASDPKHPQQPNNKNNEDVNQIKYVNDDNSIIIKMGGNGKILNHKVSVAAMAMAAEDDDVDKVDA